MQHKDRTVCLVICSREAKPSGPGHFLQGQGSLCCEDTESVPAWGWVRNKVLEIHPGASKHLPSALWRGGGGATAGHGHGQGRSSRQGKGILLRAELRVPSCGVSISSRRL